MGQLNLYKIDSQKQDEFETEIVNEYELIGNIQTVNRTIAEQQISFELSFFVDVPDGENSVEWNWLLNY